MNPNSLRANGTCPTCQRKVAEPAAPGAAKKALPATAAPPRPDDEAKAPWHFKLLVVLTVVYLVWRMVELSVALV